MNTTWSSKLAEQFKVKLPVDLRDWLDKEIWKNTIYANFGEPISPENLLDPDSSTIWGGLMVPDSQPVLGNGCGDCICIRFSPDGSVREMMNWSHEGCYWMPYGLNLYEVLIFDFVTSNSEDDEESVDLTFAQWAVSYTNLDETKKKELVELLL
ncbi:MAG: SMI1/KNR4 family protein [Sedimentisphaerales bacterium]|nr:SMI1/KNR4 family protein [Sedimentisphaerales bacterium]